MRAIIVRTEEDTTMRTYADGFLEHDDEVQCSEVAGGHCLRIGGLRIFTDLDGLARIGTAIERRLREFDTCTPVPVPAEAATVVTVDADDLFAAMAVSYDVRRGSWDGEEVAG